VNGPLDLIAIGRVSVDLYGQQLGSRLEDVATFAKAVGGCPANVAIGAARLGLKSALISRVGAEAMGHYVREQLVREGVDTSAVVVDPERLTSLVLLSVRDQHTFPLIFYRDNCADGALCESDIDEEFVASARAVLVTGTHFSMPEAAKAQRKAIDIKRTQGGKVILDIDYRPNLWGIGGHRAGESRYARSERVTATLSSVLPDCDLIVGTEEELHVAAGVEDTLEAVRRIRLRSSAVIVCKRGPAGCVVFAGPAPDTLDDGVVAAGCEVEVCNVLGAGDAFLAGFLSGYLHDEPHENSARLGNACGALAVSRLLCSSEFPTLIELHHYLAHGSAQRVLRKDARLNHLHWATTRPPLPRTLCAVSLEDLEGLAPRAPPERLARLRRLALGAVASAVTARAGSGGLVAAGADIAGVGAARSPLWVARTVGRLGFQGASLAVELTEWPMTVTVKATCRTDGPPELRRAQERELVRLAAVCRAQQRALLLEIAAGTQDAVRVDAAERVLARLYELDVRPDLWQLEAQADEAAWARCAALIARADEFCHGVLVTLDASQEEAQRSLALAARSPIVRGFAARRTILCGPVEAWLAGHLSDEALTADIVGGYRALVDAWSAAGERRPGGPERSAG